MSSILIEGRRPGSELALELSPGLPRQVVISVGPNPGPAVGSQLRVVVQSSRAKRELPLSLIVMPVRLPARPHLHLGGFDYTNLDSIYDLRSENRGPLIAYLKSHAVDSPWATKAVLPVGQFDARGNMTPTDTSAFDNWVSSWSGARRYYVFLDASDSFGGIAINSPLFPMAVKSWLTFWAAQFKRHGISTSDVAISINDETQDNRVDQRIVKWARAVHAANTGIRVWEDPAYPDMRRALPEMTNECDILCGNVQRMTELDEYQRTFWTQWRDAKPGRELALYSADGPALQLDPYAYYRLPAWLAWQTRAQSEFFWSFTDAGKGSAWNPYGKKRVDFTPFVLDPDGVRETKAMLAIVEGIEDFEYLAILAERLEAARNQRRSGPAVARAESLLASGPTRVMSAAKILPPMKAEAYGWTSPKDRTVADQVRTEILKTILELH